MEDIVRRAFDRDPCIFRQRHRLPVDQRRRLWIGRSRRTQSLASALQALREGTGQSHPLTAPCSFIPAGGWETCSVVPQADVPNPPMPGFPLAFGIADGIICALEYRSNALLSKNMARIVAILLMMSSGVLPLLTAQPCHCEMTLNGDCCCTKVDAAVGARPFPVAASANCCSSSRGDDPSCLGSSCLCQISSFPSINFVDSDEWNEFEAHDMAIATVGQAAPACQSRVSFISTQHSDANSYSALACCVRLCRLTL